MIQTIKDKKGDTDFCTEIDQTPQDIDFYRQGKGEDTDGWEE